MKKCPITLLPFETFRMMIWNSPGTKMFRSSYAIVGRFKKDILKNGELSCAYFVSSILKHFGLIHDLHATVGGTTRDLERAGYHPRRSGRPQLGDVIVWSPSADSEGHNHIGFSLGGTRAVSTSAARRCVVRHHWTYREKRKVLAVYRPMGG